jgi:hypothetical protein
MAAAGIGARKTCDKDRRQDRYDRPCRQCALTNSYRTYTAVGQRPIGRVLVFSAYLI